MKKNILAFILILIFAFPSFGQQKSLDDFLGIWEVTTKTNEIEIVKEGGKYFVIEYITIKHELFFSADKDRAIFVAFGKGPPGFNIVMLKKTGNKMDRLYFTDENYDWELSQYSYYKK